MGEAMQFEWYRAEGSHEAGLPAERDARKYPWGMFTRDGNVLAAVGMFMWFSSTDEMAAYFCEVEPQTQDVPRDELPMLQERIESALVDLRAERNLEAAREALNGGQEYWTTEWWGTFEMLARGDGEWVEDLRTSFREASEEHLDDDAEALRSPIESGEEDAFVEFIRHYGF